VPPKVFKASHLARITTLRCGEEELVAFPAARRSLAAFGNALNNADAPSAPHAKDEKTGAQQKSRAESGKQKEASRACGKPLNHNPL